MASAGADWKTNPATQIKWGLDYMNARYGSPCRRLVLLAGPGLVLSQPTACGSAPDSRSIASAGPAWIMPRSGRPSPQFQPVRRLRAPMLAEGRIRGPGCPDGTRHATSQPLDDRAGRQRARPRTS